MVPVILTPPPEEVTREELQAVDGREARIGVMVMRQPGAAERAEAIEEDSQGADSMKVGASTEAEVFTEEDITAKRWSFLLHRMFGSSNSTWLSSK